MGSLRGRIVGAAAAGVSVLGLVVVGASAAEASTATLRTQCGTFVGSGESDMDWTITAPANATRGQMVTVNVSLVGRGGTQTVALPAGSDTASMDIRLGGAGAGTVTATGLTNPFIPAGGTPSRFEGGTARVTLSQSGDVTFTPVRVSGTLRESWYSGPFPGESPVRAPELPVRAGEPRVPGCPAPSHDDPELTDQTQRQLNGLASSRAAR